MNKGIAGLKTAFIAALSVLLLTGVSMGMGVSPKQPKISIEGAEARLSTMMLGVGSVFMKIVNSGEGDDNLVGARTNIPNTVVELHDVKDGKMAKIGKIAVPGNSTVELKPKSLHIMIFEMPKDAKEGFEFSLYLMFEKSGEKQVNVKFVKGAEQHMHHSH